MIVISVVHQKGGVGKSTISQALATGLDGQTRIYDADHQGTTSRWVERRQEDGVDKPELAVGRIEQLPDLISQAENEGVNWFIIDTPPEHSGEVNLRTALSVADFAVMPTRAGANDVQVLPKTMRIARQIGVPFSVVMNEYDGRRSLHKQVLADLEDMATRNGQTVLRPLRSLAAHQDSTYAAQTAIEYAPSSDAARDMILLTREVTQITRGEQ
ncbi:ParA family protein [Sulfitobacter delicatus]|uniref:CobQ/CobB/MinD/ParA nucleotide binding domain-containing protein n=1 Tax=Sulfitobacter delicatus TaxID=218672 RepID=A0A1G7XI13_9RHOB|nr:ParA family protein [Sulfitobacter delicatus]SDG83756.1 CobQ/CobB/MinD/ParA nucleotide binding domain-containing protein [Sulfitobacter delicatus]